MGTLSMAPSPPLFSSALKSLAERFPLQRLDTEAINFLKTHLSRPWALACSGGADSLALLLLMRAHFPAQNLSILHFDHNLRPSQSAAEAQAVADMSQQLGCPFYTAIWQHGHGPSPSLEKPGYAPASALPVSVKVSEAQAREARFAFFRKTMRQIGASVLLLGHQKDDIAEQMLMRIARGSGLSGLCGPRAVHALEGGFYHVRPLLSLRSGLLRQALQQVGLSWAEDSTNTQTIYLRNRLRNQVVPVWQTACLPACAIEGAARCRSLLEEAQEALVSWARTFLPGGSGQNPQPLQLEPLRGKPPGLLRQVLYLWLLESHQQASPAWHPFQQALKHLQASEPFCINLRHNSYLVSNGELLELKPHCSVPQPAPHLSRPYTWPTESQLFWPWTGSQLKNQIIPLSPSLKDQIFSAKFSPQEEVFLNNGLLIPLESALPPALKVRTWQAGDAYRPLGAPGKLKLQDLFTNYKIKPALRRLLPVICTAQDEIIWCPGLPPAHFLKIAPSDTQALHLTYQPCAPSIQRPAPSACA